MGYAVIFKKKLGYACIYGSHVIPILNTQTLQFSYDQLIAGQFFFCFLNASNPITTNIFSP